MTAYGDEPANPVDIPADLLGHRVSLRHRVGERDGRPLFTDAVGDLLLPGDGTGDETVLVRTRAGPVRIARAAVVAVRAVPPAPPRRPSWAAVARLESLCADAWPALVERPLGAWRLRAADGFTGRANCALAVGDPGLPVPAALDAVRAFAAGNGVQPRVLAPVGSPWDGAVEREGWVLEVGHAAGPEVAVLVGELDVLAAAGGTAGVELSERPDGRWWEQALGRDPTAAERQVLAGAPDTAFGRAGDDGVVRATVVEDHLHLSRLDVRPRARRRGVATALTAAAACWGREHGARWAVLQVALQNEAARGFYGALGCTEHHRYRYLVPLVPLA